MPQKTDKQKSRRFVLKSEEGYRIELSNVPDGVTPKLIPLPDDEKEKFRSSKKDGNIGLITSIAANLVFYDQNGNEVNYFSSPIKLVYNFAREDEVKRKQRRATLVASGDLRRNQSVKLIPIYLYSYYPEKPKEKGEEKKPEFEVWQPFQNFTIDEEKKTVTVRFMFWGDEPAGWGTRP